AHPPALPYLLQVYRIGRKSGSCRQTSARQIQPALFLTLQRGIGSASLSIVFRWVSFGVP
ncbi:MAG: hypothetical protein ACU88J_11655, partial [Gammaproteobacteria bacterium]